jgi:conjugal transfer/entry exclusion protein
MQFQNSIRNMQDTNMESQRILSQVDGADGEVRQLQGVNSMLGVLSTQMNDVSQNLASSGRVSAMAVAKAQAQEDAQRALTKKYYQHTPIPIDDGQRF